MEHNPVEVDRLFGEKYCLRLQGGKVSQVRNQQEACIAQS